MRDTVQLRLALAWQIGTKIANAESSNAAVVDNTGGQNTKDRGDDRTGQDRTRLSSRGYPRIIKNRPP